MNTPVGFSIPLAGDGRALPPSTELRDALRMYRDESVRTELADGVCEIEAQQWARFSGIVGVFVHLADELAAGIRTEIPECAVLTGRYYLRCWPTKSREMSIRLTSDGIDLFVVADTCIESRVRLGKLVSHTEAGTTDYCVHVHHTKSPRGLGLLRRLFRRCEFIPKRAVKAPQSGDAAVITELGAYFATFADHIAFVATLRRGES